MTRKEQLMQCISHAIKYGMCYIGVVIKLPSGCEELIVNKSQAFMEKMEYYDVAYDDDLKMINCPQIEILEFATGNSLFTIESEIFE